MAIEPVFKIVNEPTQYIVYFWMVSKTGFGFVKIEYAVSIAHKNSLQYCNNNFPIGLYPDYITMSVKLLKVEVMLTVG